MPGLLCVTCDKFVKMTDELKRSSAFLLEMQHVCSRIEQLETCGCSSKHFSILKGHKPQGPTLFQMVQMPALSLGCCQHNQPFFVTKLVPLGHIFRLFTGHKGWLKILSGICWQKGNFGLIRSLIDFLIRFHKFADGVWKDVKVWTQFELWCFLLACFQSIFWTVLKFPSASSLKNLNAAAQCFWQAFVIRMSFSNRNSPPMPLLLKQLFVFLPALIKLSDKAMADSKCHLYPHHHISIQWTSGNQPKPSLFFCPRIALSGKQLEALELIWLCFQIHTNMKHFFLNS